MIESKSDKLIQRKNLNKNGEKQAKQKKGKENSGKKREDKSNFTARIWYLFRGVICLAIIGILVVILANSNIINMIPFLHKCDLPVIHSIVFDAGSTGSRIHVFNFYNDSGKLLLNDEIFEEVKPGLSSYANEPKKAAESLIPLLDLAKKSISKELWQSTPIVVYATAGLRLLPQDKADNILNEITEILKTYPFSMPSDAVKIMSGKDEAIFGWITINYLLGRLEHMKNTVAVMDLGGGSMQVTFLATKPSTAKSHDARTINLYGHNITLFAKSYLGLGLMEARLEVLGGTKNDYHLYKEKQEPLRLQSPCIVSKSFDGWSHRGVEYEIIGHNDPVERNFESCFLLTIPLSYSVFKAPELQSTEVYGISYFYDRAVDAQLIDAAEGGPIQIVQFYNKAKQYCEQTKEHHPFLCLDLTYITALLWKGFDLNGLRELNLYKKINGIETSWCLGASLIELSSGIK